MASKDRLLTEKISCFYLSQVPRHPDAMSSIDQHEKINLNPSEKFLRPPGNLKRHSRIKSSPRKLRKKDPVSENNAPLDLQQSDASELFKGILARKLAQNYLNRPPVPYNILNICANMSNSTPTSGKADKDAVTVYYWPLKFRGNFLKLILEEVNVPYTNASYEDELKELVFSKPVSERPFPFFAPPFIKVGEYMISQMPAACQYLAKKYGLDATSLEDSSHALMIVMNCNDIWEEITRGGGHYSMWTLDQWKTWKQHRLTKWLNILESLLVRNNTAEELGSEAFFFDNRLTYADLAVFHVLDGLCYDLSMEEFVRKCAPILHAYYLQLGRRANIKAFVAKQRRDQVAYCGGQIEKSIREVIRNEGSTNNSN